jgi:hypothetical protein
MNFHETLKANYPEAIPEADYVKSTQDALSVHGFNGDNTIACVGVCRDEITRSLVDRVQEAWGEAFNFSSLGGMLLLGKTGFGAAQHHSPVDGGRERYVYIAMSHVAICDKGDIGVCYRPGRPGASGACGALMAFRKELLGGALKLELDPNDMEQSILKQRLFRKIKFGNVPDLVSLTRIAYEVILDDLKLLLDLTVKTDVSDYAVLTGIQIHGPDKEQYIWPGEMYAVIRGSRKEIKL